MRFIQRNQADGGSSRRVVVTGLGVVTPLGNEVESVFRRVYRGESGIAPIRRPDVPGFAMSHGAEIGELDDAESALSERDRRGLERVQRFALLAAEKAVRDSGLDLARYPLRGNGSVGKGSERMGAAIGVSNSLFDPLIEALAEIGAGRVRRVSPRLLNRSRPCACAALVSIRFGLQGPVYSQNGASATGAMNLANAFDAIRNGRADVMIAGGADSGIHPVTLAAFFQNLSGSRSGRCRPFDRRRDGVVLGEGAAIVVLEEERHAVARGARIYGEMLGYGLRSDAFDMAIIPGEAPGLAMALEEAIEDAAIGREEVGYINAHGTGTRLNDVAEAATIRRAFDGVRSAPAVSGTKGQLGHLLAGSGSLEFILSLLASCYDRVPPTGGLEEIDPDCDLNHVVGTGREVAVGCALTLSAGMGGLNSAILVRGTKERWTP